MSDPKVLLLHWNRGKWSAKDRENQGRTENSCEAWIFAFGGDYLYAPEARPADLQGYDIIIANSDRVNLEHLCSLSASRPSSAKWVTSIEGDALDYIHPRPFIRELLNNSDLVNCINSYSLPFFKKFTSARVEYIGFPYPAESIRSLSTPFEKRRREIFLSPMLLSRWLEYFCVGDLGIPFYGYEKKITRTARNLVSNIRKYGTLDKKHFQKKVRSLYNDSSIDILQEVPLEDFFRRNGAAYVWLNMDQRYTWGRYILDAAALQVPIISTRSTGHAEKFFPLTMLENEFEVEKAVDLVKRLFTDREFYLEVATVPIEAFAEFRPEFKKRQLLNALSLSS